MNFTDHIRHLYFSPFTGEKYKWRMWSVKFMEGYKINGYHVLLTGDKKILADGADKTKEKEIAALKLPSFTTYNELIISQ